MGKFSGVLLATDYDDTLYSSDCTISQENRQAIARFVAEGGLFCISTGRSYINFAIQMERERLPVNTPVILSNGASIYDFATEESLWLKYLPAQAPVHLAQVCAAFPQVGFEAYHQDEVYIFRPNEVTQRHLTRCHLTGRPKAIEEMPVPWIKVILQHPDTAVLHQARTYLQTQWPETYDVTFSNPYLLEVTARGADKGLSVLWVARHLGVRPEDIYCVGNGLNDIPMLAVSALSFAPANSYPEVRAAADVVLPSCDESCVARLIEHLEVRYDNR